MPTGLVLLPCPEVAMPDVTEAESVQDVDECLALMAASLHAAQVGGDILEADRIAGLIDLALERRLQLAER